MSDLEARRQAIDERFAWTPSVPYSEMKDRVDRELPLIGPRTELYTPADYSSLLDKDKMVNSYNSLYAIALEKYKTRLAAAREERKLHDAVL